MKKISEKNVKKYWLKQSRLFDWNVEPKIAFKKN